MYPHLQNITLWYRRVEKKEGHFNEYNKIRKTVLNKIAFDPYKPDLDFSGKVRMQTECMVTLVVIPCWNFSFKNYALSGTGIYVHMNNCLFFCEWYALMGEEGDNLMN